MKKILDIISEAMMNAFEEAGYTREQGKVTISNRPDLCEFQCNGAMALAKAFHKAPIIIANEIAECAQKNDIFESVEAINPGFLNLKLAKQFLTDYLKDMSNSSKFGLETENAEKIIIDYGGPNVAKPLHVGHLRSAVIGESIKRIAKYNGCEVIGDIHLGDWGLQMGLIITELKLRKPELPYFDDDFTGEYPKEAPFTISELEEIYPTASAKSKEDPAYKELAMEATFKLQNGTKGYRALWKHILNVSVTDLKKNYEKLNVSFELWKGESDVHNVIPDMVSYMKKEGYAHESDGALVVDVKEDTDTKEIPPCMILKSDGASLYNTTDLATITERMEEYHPDQIIYVVDKRQELYFTQVFRCAKKTQLVESNTRLTFIGFGTMNGKDGKPFKTRQGGVMRLENLLSDIEEQMYQKIKTNQEVSEAEAHETAGKVALAAIKYGDLSNLASKDYIFDVDRFTSFEGDTGPYILYTIVRMKSILNKYVAMGKKLEDVQLGNANTDDEKSLMLSIAGFQSMMKSAWNEMAPNKVCAYIYDLANAFNRFYHEVKILQETNETKQASYIALLKLTKEILETSIDVLGFSSPERM